MKSNSTKWYLHAAAFALGAVLTIPASASIIKLSAAMDCAQANAGLGTCNGGGTGSGVALLELDDNSGDLNWDVSWSGMSGSTAVAHFHGPAAANANAGVQVDFYGIGGNLNPSIGVTQIDAGQQADLLAGLWYVNVHSLTFGGGEIRGQITRTNVPEPVTALLVLSGVAGMGLMRRRRRA